MRFILSGGCHPDGVSGRRCTPFLGHAVAAGQADVGLGIELAARANQLDFVPLVREDYFLVCLKSALSLPSTQALLSILRSDAWKETLGRMPGYMPFHSGEVLAMSRMLPWWRFSGVKSRQARSLGPASSG